MPAPGVERRNNQVFNLYDKADKTSGGDRDRWRSVHRRHLAGWDSMTKKRFPIRRALSWRALGAAISVRCMATSRRRQRQQLLHGDNDAEEKTPYKLFDLISGTGARLVFWCRPWHLHRDLPFRPDRSHQRPQVLLHASFPRTLATLGVALTRSSRVGPPRPAPSARSIASRQVFS